MICDAHKELIRWMERVANKQSKIDSRVWMILIGLAVVIGDKIFHFL
jgi:hypothetical protein